MTRNTVFTPEEIKALSVRAVNQLIADTEAGRLWGNKELAEVIAGCIRHSEQRQLQALQFLLDQRELEGVPPWDSPSHPHDAALCHISTGHELCFEMIVPNGIFQATMSKPCYCALSTKSGDTRRAILVFD